MTQIVYLDGLDCGEQSPRMEEALEKAARILREGGTVVFPTETVYGLGADGLNSQSVKKIYEAKGRPSDNPMILHISSLDMLPLVATQVPPKAKALMDAFWPGPLTLVLPKSPRVPLEATGGLPTVAVRMPAHALAKRLIQRAGTPVAAPSANLSGKPSPTTASHVIEDLNGRVDMILAADPADIGLESTVVDLTGPVPVLLRPGSITLEQLRQAVGDVLVDKGVTQVLSEGEAPRSPGMKYRHYAPEGRMILVKGSREGVINTLVELLQQGREERPVVMVPTEMLDSFAGWTVLDMGSIKRPEEMMHRLYGLLRRCNELKAGLILAPLFAEEDAFLALNNRLSKAAGYQILSAREKAENKDGKDERQP